MSSSVKLAPWLATIGLFVIWEGACRLFAIPEFVLPAPSQAVAALIEYWPAIWQNAFYTFWVTLVGFALAVAFGLALGIITGASALVYAAIYPLLVGFNSIPKVAIVPVLVVWFGIGTVPAVLTAFTISFFHIVEPELRDVLRALGARKIDILLKVGVPRSMPYFFASLKVAVTLAFVGTVISETVAGNAGMGHLMLTAASSFRVPLVFAGLLVIAAMGVGMYVLFAVVERRVVGWAFRGAQGG